ncbi:Ldh family oxidoreductase [Mesorhizobium escarrei]|uniref:Ldh family oxidoreductase n=1 Tax=Mesorhizobium escarrei TaxID=666018 RepID=A0ABM9DVY3_9HYPH|nr:Ldh family oxidoreductase [Mesorhizobium escarrei]CAH2400866.1 conserved hypothetical protein [Mesorhizobium escarrei]
MAPRPGAIRVDALGGFAHPAYEAGEPQLIEAARRQGIAALGVANAYACGVLGYFTDRLARAGLVSLAATNASSTMAPWGGRTPFRHQPPGLRRAARRGSAGHRQSAAATAFVNLASAAAAGREIPPPWALDARGKPTTDAREGLKGLDRAVRRPQGQRAGADGRGARGWPDRLALVVRGIVARRRFRRTARLGQSFIAFDSEAMAPNFVERLETMLGTMAAQEGVRLPGDRRHKNHRYAEQNGVPLEDAEAAALAELAGESPASWPDWASPAVISPA